VIQKINDAGWALGINEAGGVTLTAKSGGAVASLAGRSAVNDGRWHHVIAEADRKAGTFTIYIDGKQDAGGPGLGVDASLANDADLYVGGTPQGHNLDGAIDLRVSHAARWPTRRRQSMNSTHGSSTGHSSTTSSEAGARPTEDVQAP
jgi:hypothetical protein